MDSRLYLIILNLLIVCNDIQSFEDLTSRKSRKLSCMYVDMRNKTLLGYNDIMKQKAFLVLSSRKQLSKEYFDSEGITFILKDSPVNTMKFLKEHTLDLVCEVNPYFTDNTQIIWPGIHVIENMEEAWFVSRFKHPNDKFQFTLFFTHISQKSLEEQDGSQLQAFPNAEIRYVLPVFMLSTQTPHVQTRLQEDALLNCDFSIDHHADVNIVWKLLKKGGQEMKLLTYKGSEKSVVYHVKGIAMYVDEVPKGSASLVVKNVDLEKEGLYTCSVSVNSLFGDQVIHLEVVEPPIVNLNVKSLLLTEGQEQKLVCEASKYYPLDVNIEWLREGRDQTLLPTVLKNVLYSSHKHNNDGTYSLSSFFIFTASQLDNGAVLTCRVEHMSLKHPIRKSVKVRVEESPSYQEFFLGGARVSQSTTEIGVKKKECCHENKTPRLDFEEKKETEETRSYSSFNWKTRELGSLKVKISCVL
ncbi:tapasin-related protein isoform X2 [Xenopus laevis]|uniref:Tapasin-related protein isoform X2 n=1 Tax=Xenopus laevis TaxID=8355 RepID=A0A8J1M835_XENLA|nr:tapasin-related protein isoform X2 [Xenopus laevis]